jgi:hypothetical protein
MDFTILKEDVEVWGGQFVETEENGQVMVTRKAFDVTKSFDLLPSVFYTSYTENKLALPKLEGIYFP